MNTSVIICLYVYSSAVLYLKLSNTNYFEIQISFSFSEIRCIEHLQHKSSTGYMKGTVNHRAVERAKTTYDSNLISFQYTISLVQTYKNYSFGLWPVDLELYKKALMNIWYICLLSINQNLLRLTTRRVVLVMQLYILILLGILPFYLLFWDRVSLCSTGWPGLAM